MTGKQFKEVIKQSGLKQTFVAKEVGVHQATLSRFLNGKERLNESKIQRLTDLLKVDSFLH